MIDQKVIINKEFGTAIPLNGNMVLAQELVQDKYLVTAELGKEGMIHVSMREQPSLAELEQLISNYKLESAPGNRTVKVDYGYGYGL